MSEVDLDGRAWRISPLAAALGAECRGFEMADLNDSDVQILVRLLDRYKVLFFPDQRPTPELQIEFGERFGTLEDHPHLENPTPGLPEKIFELSADHGGVADEWHTDLTYLENPALYSILHMLVVPAIGGDTLWSNTALAYEELSPPIQALCEGLNAIHDGTANDAPESQAVHPVVRVHPNTGRRILYVNEHFTRRIVEVSHEESALLLGHLTRWVSNPRFTLRYRWTPGTVAIWDNRATQHFVLNDFAGERRIQRVTVMGDLVEAAAPTKWPVYARSGTVSDTSRRDAVLRFARLTSGRSNRSAFHRLAVARVSAQLPDVPVHHEVVDVDHRDTEEHALRQPETDELEREGPDVEEQEAQDDAGGIEPDRDPERATRRDFPRRRIDRVRASHVQSPYVQSSHV